MRTQRVYDLPLRLFHWLFALTFVCTFSVAKIFDDDSLIFIFHMLGGLLLGFLVLLRGLWGLVGSKNSRWKEFALQPFELKSYFYGILAGERRKWGGHNPASSWAALAMFACVGGLVGSGLLMHNFEVDIFEEAHELFAHAFLLLVFMHLGGLLFHQWRHRDGIGWAMVDGKKQDVPVQDEILNSSPWTALLFVIVVMAFSSLLIASFDTKTRTLHILNTRLFLGEDKKTSGEH